MSIHAELTSDKAPWAADRQKLADSVAAEAFEQFDRAFDRWRQLYRGARAQLVDANRRSEMHGLSAEDRREAKLQQAQANEQIALLERGNTSGNSDFYTYRYLATEGFLPGYNFPRLPLYAYVPAGAGSPTFLQRARFLAIAEFGPRSLVYHEGRAYRVFKAKLPPEARDAEGRLITRTLYVCANCGAGHEEVRERCHACGASMTGTEEITHVLRIDNVETTPQERITANDEDRQRQGFELQTVFAWPWRDGRPDVVHADVADDAGPLCRIDYATGALISRVNKGLRRRAEKSLFGFMIDPATGVWTKLDDDDRGDGRQGSPPQRIVPIVQDHKNAALLRLSDEPLQKVGMATLQHALTRGLELCFQIEEGEVLVEPTPSREHRRALLAYEASEGGAGVLGRLASETDMLAQVARMALSLMHFDGVDEAIASTDPAMLQDVPEADCVKGCYRCLLSYYNQPDHEVIDRTDSGALRVLLRLAKSRATLQTGRTAGPGLVCDAPSSSWYEAFAAWGLPRPDDHPVTFAGTTLLFAWRAYLVAALSGAIPPDARAAGEAQGFTLVALPPDPGALPPAELLAALGAPI